MSRLYPKAVNKKFASKIKYLQPAEYLKEKEWKAIMKAQINQASLLNLETIQRYQKFR